MVALFAYPRVAAHAQVLFPVAEDASITQMIEQFSSTYGVDGTLALSIANCESQLNAQAKNPDSTAKGIYQFLDSSWDLYSRLHWGESRDVLDSKSNIELGVWVLSQDGTQPWESSRLCWEPLISN